MRFQNYDSQKGRKHAQADKLSVDGQWANVPGALRALEATKEILIMYKNKQPFGVVETYLRTEVYKFASGAQNVRAGGSVEFYKKKI